MPIIYYSMKDCKNWLKLAGAIGFLCIGTAAAIYSQKADEIQQQNAFTIWWESLVLFSLEAVAVVGAKEAYDAYKIYRENKPYVPTLWNSLENPIVSRDESDESDDDIILWPEATVNIDNKP